MREQAVRKRVTWEWVHDQELGDGEELEESLRGRVRYACCRDLGRAPVARRPPFVHARPPPVGVRRLPRFGSDHRES